MPWIRFDSVSKTALRSSLTDSAPVRILTRASRVFRAIAASSSDGFSLFKSASGRVEKERRDAEAKAEAERQALIAEQKKETDRIAAIQKEKDEKASAERAALQAELLAKEKADQERKEAENARIAAEEKAKKDAMLAPDKEKLQSLAITFSLVELPELATTEAQLIIENIKILQGKLIGYIKEQSDKPQ